MMQGLLNAMRLQAMLAGGGRTSTLMGTVSSYDPAKYSAKVMLQPENIESGWLPVASPWVGNGWGLAAPPTPGDVVTVVCQEGDVNAGIVCLRLFTDKVAVPSLQSGGSTTYPQSGEFWLVHQSGSMLKFHNDGSVELASNKNLTVTVGGDMNATVTGNVNATVSGALNATATGKAVITASEIDLVGTGGTANGIVQADCVCAFTGAPHPMVSSKVKGSL